MRLLNKHDHVQSQTKNQRKGNYTNFKLNYGINLNCVIANGIGSVPSGSLNNYLDLGEIYNLRLHAGLN